MPKLTTDGNTNPAPSRFAVFSQKWAAGCGSDDCGKAFKRVLCRGQIPCDVLLCGEGPGRGEDTLGIPFCGPAGQLIQSIVDEAAGQVRLCSVCRRAQVWNGKQMTCPNRHTGAAPDPVRIAWTNVVACIPRDFDGQKAGEPSEEQKEACQPRLEEFIALARPRLIVCVGTVARDWLAQGFKMSVKLPEPRPRLVSVDHPAYILRMNQAQVGLAVQRCTVIIRNAIEDL